MELLSFSAGGSAYLIDVARVREVVGAGDVVMAGGEPGGSVVVRGERLPLIEIGAAREAEAYPLIVIDGRRGAAALQVDAVGEVRDFPRLEVEPVPSYYGVMRAWVSGVVVDGDAIATLVDGDALIAELSAVRPGEERSG